MKLFQFPPDRKHLFTENEIQSREIFRNFYFVLTNVAR